ncbi:MAG TPA: cob(I)yrinic acid a,c-diamide adenosyltransferase [Planctomycetaceae bacterium]|nr:cob(I)yrinic acid a,c-diamide adenosyltransferase [Planctomycetaceae bacterium]
MVYLDRIYTKSGDAGQTSLGDGTRVPKTDSRIVAYGTVDELNSLIGVVIAAGSPEPVASRLKHIQNDLFDLGADLCVPATPVPEAKGRLRVTPQQVSQLEAWIDAATEQLEPLKSFVLPGGTPASAYLHLARTVCRRAEIKVLLLAESAPINPQVTIYLNRLSDLLFVWARLCNEAGHSDVLWVPGKFRALPKEP